MVRDARRSGVPGAALALAAALLMSGCGAGGSTATTNAGSSGTPSAGVTAAPTASGSQPASPSPAGSSLPTLPPGDPGTDAPGTDDPNATPSQTEDHGSAPARTAVPGQAMLDAATVASMTGSQWSTGAAPKDSCTAPLPRTSVAHRSVALSGGSAGGILETVATYRDAAAAVAAVRDLERRLAACHDSDASDPRIGEASVQATVTSPDGTTTLVTAIAAEGVVAVLSGKGPVTAADLWSSLTDLALGNTCAAAADGCH